MVYTIPAPKPETKRDENDNDKPKVPKSITGGSGGFAITKDMVKNLKKEAKNNETKKIEEEAVAKSVTPPPQEPEKPTAPIYDWGNAPGRTMQTSAAKTDTQECEMQEPEKEVEFHIVSKN